MAVIKEVQFGQIFSGIKAISNNCFYWGDGVVYFAFLRTDNHAVVYASTDEGGSWSLMWDFGVSAGISLGYGSDGTNPVVVATQWFSGSGGWAICYGNGVPFLEGFFGTNQSISDAYYAYPVLLAWVHNDQVGYSGVSAALGLGSGSVGQFSPNIQGSIGGAPYFIETFGMRPDGYLEGLAYHDQDVFGPSNPRPVMVGDWRMEPQDPQQPQSPWALKNTTIFLDTYDEHGIQTPWPGLQGGGPSGFQTYIDFAGVTAGTASFHNNGVYVPYRAMYFSGYSINGAVGRAYAAPVPCDQGMLGANQVATVADVDGYPATFFIDRAGLFGSSTLDGDPAIPDSSGVSSPFGRCKIYGNLPGTSWATARLWTRPRQSKSLTVFMLAAAANTYNNPPYTMYRLHDPDALLHYRNATIQRLSTLPPQEPLTFGYQDTVVSDYALGMDRADQTLPDYTLDLLKKGCTNPNALPNPNKSPGCSPVLRALLDMSGLAFSVIREVANDGQIWGHAGGNAIDVTGPTIPGPLQTTLDDIQGQEIVDITNFLRAVPSLFATVIFYDPENSTRSLFIYDGKVTDATPFGGLNSKIVQNQTDNVHISSSGDRLLAALNTPLIQARLGIGPAAQDPSTLKIVSSYFLGQFGDRYVYVNQDPYTTSKGIKGISVYKEEEHKVTFW